jgi:hypothetical protein
VAHRPPPMNYGLDEREETPYTSTLLMVAKPLLQLGQYFLGLPRPVHIMLILCVAPHLGQTHSTKLFFLDMKTILYSFRNFLVHNMHDLPFDNRSRQ